MAKTSVERQRKLVEQRKRDGLVRIQHWIPRELSAQVDAWVRRQVQQYQQQAGGLKTHL